MKHIFEFSTHKRLQLGLSFGSNNMSRGIPQNFFFDIDFLFFTLVYETKFKLTHLPKALSFVKRQRDSINQIVNWKSKIIKGHLLTFNLREIISTNSLSFRASIGPRCKDYELSFDFLRWHVSLEISKPDYSFFVALERMCGLPNLFVSKDQAQYSCVKEDSLKILGVKIPASLCDDWKTKGNS